MSAKAASSREDFMELEESKNEEDTATKKENIIQSPTSEEEEKTLPVAEEVDETRTPQEMKKPADANEEKIKFDAVEERMYEIPIAEDLENVGASTSKAASVVKKNQGSLKENKTDEEETRTSVGAETWPVETDDMEMEGKQAEVTEAFEKVPVTAKEDVEVVSSENTPVVKKKSRALKKENGHEEGGRKRSLRKLVKNTPSKMDDVGLDKNKAEDEEELENTTDVAAEDVKKVKTKAGSPVPIVKKKLVAPKQVATANDEIVDLDNKEAVDVDESITDDVTVKKFSPSKLKNFLPGLTVTAVLTEEVEQEEGPSRREEKKLQNFPPGLIVTAVPMEEEEKEAKGEEVKEDKLKEEGELEEEVRTPAMLEAPESPMGLLEAPESPVVLGAMGMPLHSPGRMACPLQVLH